MSVLADAVVALRVWIFARVNGDREVTLPGELGGAEVFERVYADPAANGRSRGAGLSDLFWYWLAPGPEVHQEHLEAGPRYDAVARTTREILSLRTRAIEDLATRAAVRVLGELPPAALRATRLRDLMMPIWAEFFYELVFREPCPREARDLIVANADDVVTALKCTGLRHMRRRDRLTRYLRARIEAGDVPHPLPDVLTPQEQAYYLQGTFFNTAVVQTSEGMAHLLLAIALHPDTQRRLVAELDDPRSRHLRDVQEEVLRRYPLFGIAHRITTADIDAGPAVIPSGTVVCFDHEAYERLGVPDPDRFDPGRWEGRPGRNAHHIPYGVAANRPCPAWRLAPIAMRAVTRVVLARYRLASSVAHTRSIPHRAPCLLADAVAPPPERRVRRALAMMRLRDGWEDVTRSVVQLVLGTVMVLDARRLKLCTNHFAQPNRTPHLADRG